MLAPLVVGGLAHTVSLHLASLFSGGVGLLALAWYARFTPETLKPKAVVTSV
jgi:hypothetical protein